jgi:hypothetical protein
MVANQTVQPPRQAYLDLTKGILVILMVVYHSFNYTTEYHLGFRYLSFLPPSFILITGYLLSTVYRRRYQAGDRGLVGRLLIRGGKLVVLFTVLNVIAQFVRSPAYGRSVGVEAFFQQSYEVFLLGSGGNTAAFEVLLPIAYILLIGPVLLALAHRYPLLLILLTLLIVITCIALDLRGKSIANLNLVSAGLLGMLAGWFVPNPHMLSRYVWIPLLAYAAYFPISLARGYVYFIQLLGAGIALALIAGVSMRIGERTWWQPRLNRIGQYSLLSYIAQIGILQILSRFYGRPDPWSPHGLGLFLMTLMMTALIVECTDWIRTRSSGAERLYKVVFA